MAASFSPRRSSRSARRECRRPLSMPFDSAVRYSCDSLIVAVVLLQTAAELIVQGRILRIFRQRLLQQLDPLRLRGVSSLPLSASSISSQDVDGVLRIGAGSRQLVRTAAGARQVAERFELIHHALVQHRRFHLLAALPTGGDELLELRFEVLHLRAMLLDDVAGLARDRRSGHRVRAAARECTSTGSCGWPGAPTSSCSSSGTASRRRRCPSPPVFPEKTGDQAEALHIPSARGRPSLRAAWEGNRSCAPAASRAAPAGIPGPAMMNGMRKCRVVDENAVCVLAMFAKTFAMVGEHRERPSCPLVTSFRRQLTDVRAAGQCRRFRHRMGGPCTSGQTPVADCTGYADRRGAPRGRTACSSVLPSSHESHGRQRRMPCAPGHHGIRSACRAVASRRHRQKSRC